MKLVSIHHHIIINLIYTFDGSHISAVNGVVIACDKKVASVLVDSADYQKIQSITPTTGTTLLIK